MPPRFQHGDRAIPAALLNEYGNRLDALTVSVLPDGTMGPDGQMVLPPPPDTATDTLLVKITAKDGATPPAYSWERIDEAAGGVASTHPDAGFVNGVPAYYPAYEENGNPDVPLGSVVRLFPALGRTYWWFSWQPWGGTFSAPVTFTGDVTFAEGDVSFPTTTNPATPPAGRLAIPYLDDPDSPTYPPASNGELLCGKNGSIYQGNPSNPGGPWMRYLPTFGPLPPPGGDPQFPYYNPDDKGYELLPLPAVRAPARVATTTNGTLSTAFAAGQTVDGITLMTDDRLLLKDQTTASDNGIYTVNASGTPTRAADADTGGKLVAGSLVIVTEGTANHDTAWLLTTDDPIMLGTTALAFAQLGGAGAGAPVGASYVTLATDATLTSERVLTAGANVTITDGGAGGAVTIAAGLPSSPVAVTLGGTPTLSTVRQWYKVTGISRTDFSTAGTTRTITAVVLPAKGIVHEAVIKSTAAFTGGAITAYKIDLKISGNTVIGLYDAFAAPSNTGFGNNNESSVYLGKPWNFGATVNIDLTATSTGANLSAATAGALDLYLEMSKLE